jgi:hypothetical protein
MLATSHQSNQDGLQMDNEEEGDQGVHLADGEQDGEDGGDPMEEERGHGLSVKGGNQHGVDADHAKDCLVVLCRPHKDCYASRLLLLLQYTDKPAVPKTDVVRLPTSTTK